MALHEHDDGCFDAAVAARYDDDSAMFSAERSDPVVTCLARLAGAGSALELGIGTGRIALPLAAQGVAVHGIDLSRPMLARLAEKPGSNKIPVTTGDFATTTVNEKFSVVYLVFNTIMNLVTQEEQIACFQNAANHLVPGGRFVIEVMVPELQALPQGETLRTFALDEDHIGVDDYNTVNQALTSYHFNNIDGQAVCHSVPMRYVWPSELDLMALLAGMPLESRWSDWHGSEFTRESKSHVSVWRTPD